MRVIRITSQVCQVIGKDGGRITRASANDATELHDVQPPFAHFDFGNPAMSHSQAICKFALSQSGRPAECYKLIAKHSVRSSVCRFLHAPNMGPRQRAPKSGARQLRHSQSGSTPTRVRWHLTSASNDFVTNRQFDSWEIASCGVDDIEDGSLEGADQ